MPPDNKDKPKEKRSDKPSDDVMRVEGQSKPDKLKLVDSAPSPRIKEAAFDLIVKPGESYAHAVAIDPESLHYLFVACSKTCDVTIGEQTRSCDWSQPIEWSRGDEPLLVSAISSITVTVPGELTKEVVCSVRYQVWSDS